MSKNWKRGLALLMAAMMLAPSSNLTAWQTALGTAIVAEATELTSADIMLKDAKALTPADVASIKHFSGADDTTGTLYTYSAAITAGWNKSDLTVVNIPMTTAGTKVKIEGVEYTYADAVTAQSAVAAGWYNGTTKTTLPSPVSGSTAEIDGDTTYTYKTISDDSVATDGWYAESTLKNSSDLEADGVVVTISTTSYTYKTAKEAVDAKAAGWYPAVGDKLASFPTSGTLQYLDDGENPELTYYAAREAGHYNGSSKLTLSQLSAGDIVTTTTHIYTVTPDTSKGMAFETTNQGQTYMMLADNTDEITLTADTIDYVGGLTHAAEPVTYTWSSVDTTNVVKTAVASHDEQQKIKIKKAGTYSIKVKAEVTISGENYSTEETFTIIASDNKNVEMSTITVKSASGTNDDEYTYSVDYTNGLDQTTFGLDNPMDNGDGTWTVAKGVSITVTATPTAKATARQKTIYSVKAGSKTALGNTVTFVADAGTVVEIATKVGLDTDVVLASPDDTVKTTIVSGASKIDGTAFSNAVVLADGEYTSTNPTVYLSAQADAVLKIKAEPVTGKKISVKGITVKGYDNTNKTTLLWSTDSLDTGKYDQFGLTYDATSKIYNVLIPKTKLATVKHVVISVDTETTITRKLTVKNDDGAKVTVYRKDDATKTALTATNNVYELVEGVDYCFTVEAKAGYKLANSLTKQASNVTITDKLMNGSIKNEAEVTMSGGDDKITITQTAYKYNRAAVTYTATTGIKANSAAGVIVSADNVALPASSFTELATATNAVDYNKAYSFYVYSVDWNSVNSKYVASATKAPIVTAQLVDTDSSDNTNNVGGGTAALPTIDVPVTRSNNRYTIAAENFKVPAGYELQITVDQATVSSTTATSATVKVTDPANDDAAVSRIDVVTGGPADLVYEYEFKSAEGGKTLVSDLQGIVVTGDTSLIDTTTTPGKIKVLTNGVNKPGSATVKFLYNGEVVSELPITVTTGIGTSVKATAANTTDVKSDIKVVTDANVKAVTAAGDKLYAVALAVNKVQTADQENNTSGDAIFRNRAVGSAAVGKDGVAYVPLNLGYVSEGYGAASSWDVKVVLIRSASAPTITDYDTVTKFDSESATAIAAKLGLTTTATIATIAPTYETKMTIKKGQTTVVSGIDYADLMGNGKVDKTVKAASISYTGKTSFKGYHVTNVVTKKLNTFKYGDIGYGVDYKNLGALWTDGTLNSTNILSYVSFGKEGEGFYIKDTSNVAPGVYEFTLEADYPSGIKIANPATAKLSITVLPEMYYEPSLNNTTTIVREDNTKKNVTATPFVISKYGSIKSVTYAIDAETLVDEFGTTVTSKASGISVASNGKVTLNTALKSLKGYQFDIVAKITLSDGTIITAAEDSSLRSTITISNKSDIALASAALMKTSDVTTTINKEKIVDSITFDERNAFSVVPMSFNETSEAYTQIAASDVIFTSSNKNIGVDVDGTVYAHAIGKATITIKAKDASAQQVKFVLNVTKPINSPEAKIYAYDWDNSTFDPIADEYTAYAYHYTNVSGNIGFAKEVKNTCDVLAPIYVDLVALDSTTGAEKYIETAISITGGKVIYKSESSLLEKNYRILPTAKTTVIKVTNKLDKTDVKEYTITNDKWVDTKALAFANSKINGNAGAETSQMLTVKISGNVDTLESAGFVKLSIDSLSNAYTGKTGSAYDKAYTSYQQGGKILNRLKANNKSSDVFAIKSTKDAKGKVTYYLDLDATNTNNAKISKGTYTLDASIFGYAADGKSIGDKEITKKGTVKITVTAVNPTHKVNTNVTIKNVLGEKVSLVKSIKNGTIEFTPTVFDIKDTKTGKLNEFSTYFGVDRDGTLVVKKAGASGKNLKGVVKYTVKDAAGTVFASKSVTITVKTQKAADASALLTKGLNEAVSGAAITAYVKDTAYSTDNGYINDDDIKFLVAKELLSRGYNMFGTNPVTPANVSSSVWADISITGSNYTQITKASAGKAKATVVVRVATDFYTAADEADNPLNKAGTPKPDCLEPIAQIEINTTFGARLANTALDDVKTLIDTAFVNANLADKFSGTEAKDKEMLLSLAKELAGTGYTVAYKSSGTADVWSYTKNDLTANGSATGTFVVTEAKTGDTLDVSFSLTANQIESLETAKSEVDAAITAATFKNGVTKADIARIAKEGITQSDRFSISFKTGEDALTIKNASNTKTGSVIGVLVIKRTDGLKQANAVESREATVNKAIDKVGATIADASAAVNAAFNASDYTVNVSGTNSAIAAEIKAQAQNALDALYTVPNVQSSKTYTNGFTAKVTNFTIKKTTASGKTKTEIGCKIVIVQDNVANTTTTVVYSKTITE